MRQRWEDGFNCLLGIWLFLSPWVLNYVIIQTADWNAYIIGNAFVVFTLWALWHRNPGKNGLMRCWGFGWSFPPGYWASRR